MKKIAAFFKHPNPQDPPFDKDEYWRAYQEFDEIISQKGAQLLITRDNSTYLGNGKFSKAWKFEDKSLVEVGPVTVDIVYDKGEFKSDETVPVLNDQEINKICTDKFLTYNLFKEYCPKTIKVGNAQEFEQALSEVPGEIKVIKPLRGKEGDGVFIGDVDYLKGTPHSFPLIVQEFLDTSSGIPGVYEGIHDLRLVFISGELIYSFYRTPPEGELLANVAQGGDLTVISKDKVPEAVFKIAKIIKQNFQGKYCFGVDIGFVDGEPKIIELNSRVALFAQERGEEFKVFMEKLAELLID